MKKMTKKNKKYGCFIQKCRRKIIVKHCDLIQLKTMGKFSQTSPMKNDDTVCLYSKNNKIILFCTHIVGYFIYKHHTVGLVLKVNPQLHCCYQTQSIKHTHQKISHYQDISLTQEQKCKGIYSKMSIRSKSLATVVYLWYHIATI